MSFNDASIFVWCFVLITFFCTLNLTNNNNIIKMRNIYWPVYIVYINCGLFILIIKTQILFVLFFPFFFGFIFFLYLCFFLLFQNQFDFFFCTIVFVVVVVWEDCLKLHQFILCFLVVCQTININANYILSYYHYYWHLFLLFFLFLTFVWKNQTIWKMMKLKLV